MLNSTLIFFANPSLASLGNDDALIVFVILSIVVGLYLLLAKSQVDAQIVFDRLNGGVDT